MARERIETFAEFWPYYLGEHNVPRCRHLHFVGTTLALANLVMAVLTLSPVFLASGVVSGYLFAWIGHFFVEKNRPATFTYPRWSLVADFKMWALMLRGKLWSGTAV
jgi:hypothetical protein